MPRHTYWTIILEGGPTAFRAHRREDLLPTLKQLQSRHPDTVMKWFARGRLWNSPEEAGAHARIRRSGAAYRQRGPDWRPGGEHRDPRDRFGKKGERASRGGRQERPYRPTGGTRRGGGGRKS